MFYVVFATLWPEADPSVTPLGMPIYGNGKKAKNRAAGSNLIPMIGGTLQVQLSDDDTSE